MLCRLPYWFFGARASEVHLSFFFNDTAPTETYTLSLHDALPICVQTPLLARWRAPVSSTLTQAALVRPADRKSTRLNSSHITISYAVFCLKKKTNQKQNHFTIKKKKNKK